MQPRQSQNNPPTDKSASKGSRNMIAKTLKWCAITALSCVGLVIAVIAIALWVLTPDRLTPMVNRYASDYIEGTLTTSRIELTFWSTFPRMTVEVDSLRLVSHVFAGLTPAQKDQLPAYADSLLSIDHFNGGISLTSLAAGHIDLSDVTVKGMRANIVQYSDSLANYDIVPSDEIEEDSAELPDISLNRFTIEGNTPLRYFSLPDSIDVTAHLTSTSLADRSPVYNLHIDGKGWMTMADRRWLDAMPFGLDGALRWSPRAPGRISLEEMTVGAGNLHVNLDAVMDFSDMPTLHEFRLRARSLKISDIIDLVPPAYADGLDELTTDIALDLDITLSGPFRPMEDELPTADVTLTIPEGSLSYDRLRLSTVKGVLKAHIEGQAPDASTVSLSDLRLIGQGIGLRISGEATNLLTDPLVNASIEGGADFSRLPRQLLAVLPFTVAGHLTAEGDLTMRASYLARDRFHLIKATGNFTLDGLKAAMRDSSMAAYARHTRLRFGTTDRMTTAAGSADSLLTAAISADTVALTLPEMTVAAKNLRAGVGMRNVAATADTTLINPVGLAIAADRLTVDMPADTMRVRARDIKARGSVRRYNSDARRPHLSLNVDASSIRLRDRFNRVNLRDGSFTFSANTKAKPTMTKRVELLFDSIRAVRPELRPDSVLTLARRAARSRRTATDTIHTGRNGSTARGAARQSDIDLRADRSVRRLLTWWEASGTLKARRGSLYTPYLPLRNRLYDLDVRFSTDSVRIINTRYRLGESDFLINGTISDIESATTSRRGAPLKIDFTLVSDTININQISQAVFAGSAFAEKVAKGSKVDIADTDSDDEMQRSIEANARPDDKLAFIVPGNIEANLTVNARDVLYADIWAHRLNGRIGIANGRINLHRFAAFTAMGSIDLTALYTAPDFDDLSFAGGLVVRKLNLEKFLHMLPEIDSIMPLLRDVEGIITAEIAMTTELDSLMDLRFHTLNLAMKLSGDSLVLLDSKTFKKVSKWLLFKKKDRNMIDHMSVEMAIKDSRLDLYPFVFDLDRYKLGVSGGNDFEGNFDYHIAVLKSPIPFRFGVTVKGHGDRFKIRLGKARFNENVVASSRQLTDTARINLLEEIESVFKFGVKSGKREKLLIRQPQFTAADFEVSDTLTRADSLLFIREGVLEAPPGYLEEVERQEQDAAAIEAKEKKKRHRFLFF